MQGKICIVTGANSGIGIETTRQLAAKGATVVMVCREQSTGQAALDEVARSTGSRSLELRIADLSSQGAVRVLAAEIARDHAQVHVLINNAGVMRHEFTRTVDGYEMTFAVNHLAPFLLTNLLLDAIKAGKGRVVNLMGNSGPLNFDDLMGEKHYDMMTSYPQSKTANRLFTVELAKRLAGTGAATNGADPGFVATNLGRDARGSFKTFLDSARPTMRTAQKAAEIPVHVASSPQLEGISGRTFADSKDTKGRAASQGAADEAQAARLWDVSAKLTGLS
jgi:NAD(P)-dependent dehydrogenase (short-subunit alcohol dehydrogenase family)